MQAHENFPEGYPHEAVKVFTYGKVRAPSTFRPQHVVFTMKDGDVLDFYPDGVPQYLGGLYQFFIGNEAEAYNIDADAVLRMTTEDQANEGKTAGEVV